MEHVFIIKGLIINMETEDFNRRNQRETSDRLKREREEEARKEQKKRQEMHARIKKSVSKRNQKPFYKRYEDEIGYAIVGLIVAGVLWMNFTGDRRSLGDIMVLDETHIQAHNEAGRAYTLKENDYFEGKTLEDAQAMFYNKFTDKKDTPKCIAKEDLGNIPLSYNFYEAYPNCKFGEVQRKKSTGYVETPLSVYRERYCRQKLGEDFVPTPDYALNCNLEMNRREKGGYLVRTLDFMNENGVVSQTCWNQLNLEEEVCPSEAELEKCTRHGQSSYCMIENVNDIQTEIWQSGPVISMLQPLRNLFAYESGILDINEYEPKLDGFLTVKIIGWDRDEEDNLWWLVDPMWGSSFGEKGLVKVKIGSEDSFLDKFAMAVYPENIA